ncbi:MAG: 4-amino-4-deoxy-L-arabinose transferase, partial [Hyphomonadaceae bacterium]
DWLHPEELLEFLASQAGVVGPVLFVVLGFAFWSAAAAPRALSREDRFLLAFILPPLIIILAQALISRAHANWAAAAYPAAIVWLAGRLCAERTGKPILIGALATQLALGALILTIGVAPALGDRIGLSDALKRNRGWAETAEVVAARAEAGDYSAILTDHRATFFELSYYLRDRREALPPLRMWLLREAPLNHAEAVAPLRAEESQNILSVQTVPRYEPFLAADFQRYTPLGAADIALGGGEIRRLVFGRAHGFAPMPRDAAFAARLED